MTSCRAGQSPIGPAGQKMGRNKGRRRRPSSRCNLKRAKRTEKCAAYPACEAGGAKGDNGELRVGAREERHEGR